MDFFAPARDDSASGVQTLCVYELNEHDRGSPVFLPFGGKKNADGSHLNSLGDLVPLTNKVVLLYSSHCLVHFHCPSEQTFALSAFQ